MFSAVPKAFADTFSPQLRGVMVRSLLLALALLLVIGVGTMYGLETGLKLGADWDWPYLEGVIDWLSVIFVTLGLVLLLMPVSALFAGLFLEEVAGAVEARHYQGEPVGRDQPFSQGLWIALKFTGLLIVLNIIALPLYFIPVVNVVVYWGLNGYLLGREYFELVALRHGDPQAVRLLRLSARGRVFAGGVAIATLATVPIFNLLTPFFATALMVHLHKQVGASA